jgi:hypothetical protein
VEESTVSDDSGTSTIVVGVMGLIGTFVTGILAWIAGRAPATAAQQNALNQSFEQYREAMDSRVTALEGELRAERQYVQSLIEFLRRQGIDVPARPAPAEIIFMVPPTPIRGVN